MDDTNIDELTLKMSRYNHDSNRSVGIVVIMHSACANSSSNLISCSHAPSFIVTTNHTRTGLNPLIVISADIRLENRTNAVTKVSKANKNSVMKSSKISGQCLERFCDFYWKLILWFCIHMRLDAFGRNLTSFTKSVFPKIKLIVEI